MQNILSLAKNLVYNLDTIEPVDITDELPKNQKMFSDKQGDVSVFGFLIQFLGGRSSFWSCSNWHCFSLIVKSFWYRLNW